jgi:Deoxyribonuclease NucA/NucB
MKSSHVRNGGKAKARPPRTQLVGARPTYVPFSSCDPLGVTLAVRTRAATAALLTSVLLVTGIGSQGAAAGQTACKRVARHVILDLNDDKHHHVIDHAFDARRAGQPRVLHIRRGEARANRRASLRGIPTRRGYDRDEYPPAMSDEGGKGAHVRYIRSSENRSAGRLMGVQLRPFCNGQSFVFER